MGLKGKFPERRVKLKPWIDYEQEVLQLKTDHRRSNAVCNPNKLLSAFNIFACRLNCHLGRQAVLQSLCFPRQVSSPPLLSFTASPHICACIYIYLSSSLL